MTQTLARFFSAPLAETDPELAADIGRSWPASRTASS